MTTRLYLDIDGVVTFTDHSPHDPAQLNLFAYPFRRIERRIDVDGGTWLLDFDPGALLDIVGMFDEVVWSTSWILFPEALAQAEEVLGLAPYLAGAIDLTAEEFRSGYAAGGSGKLGAVLRHVEEHPVDCWVWADDHIDRQESYAARKLGGHVVIPSYDTGGIYMHTRRLGEILGCPTAV